MLLHDIPREILRDGESRDGVFISIDFMNAIRAFKRTFGARNVQVMVENGEVVWAGCSRGADMSERDTEYREIEDSWVLWPTPMGNWLQIYEREHVSHDYDPFSWDWIIRIRHESP